MGMKCVQCGADNLLADRTRTGGRCKQCNHPFVFEPTAVTDKRLAFTDPFFQKAIADISTQNILFFTPKQFQYFLNNRLRSRPSLDSTFGWIFVYFFLSIFANLFLGGMFSAILQNSNLGGMLASILYNAAWIYGFFRASRSPQRDARSRRNNTKNLRVLGIIILVIGIFGSVISQSIVGYFIAMTLGLTSLWLGILQKRRQRNVVDTFLVRSDQSQDWLDRWQRVNNKVEKLLPPPRTQALPASIDPEVSNYSFDRLIVCEEEAIAQFLIANNVHFENNCAILSIGGYPQSIFATAMEMLRRNPDLKVYALHNAGSVGAALVYQLRNSPEWFANQSVAIFDLGVSPRQVLASPGMFVQQSDAFVQTARQLPAEVRQSLTPDELQWLEEGRFVELESFSPQRLLRVVNQGIAQSDNPQSDGNLVLLDDGPMYGGGYVFMADSFG